MARKPAKPADAAIDDTPVEENATGTTIAAEAADAHTKGAEPAEQHADAPITAPDEDGQGPAGGGEDRSDLPAVQEPDDDAARSALALAVASLGSDPMPLIPAGTDIGFIAADRVLDLMVVCHRKDGRRRAGRKWAAGETPVSSADLTEYQLVQLRGDPAFTVFHVEKE